MATPREALLVAFDLHQSGRPAEAELLYRRIVEAVPDLADAHHLLGVLLAEQGRTGEAIAALGEAIALYGDNADYHANLGNALRAGGRAGEAVGAFLHALALKPDHPAARQGLAIACRDAAFRDPAKADAALRCAIAAAPDLPEPYKERVHLAAGSPQNVVTSAERAVRLWPEDAGAFLLLAVARQGLTGQETVSGHGAGTAMAAYRAALALRPALADAWNNIGGAEERLARYDSAAAFYRRALTAAPAEPRILTNLALALHRQGRFDDAMETHAEALRRAPDMPILHANRSLTLLIEGLFEEGWRAYEQGLHCEGSPRTRRAFPQPRWDGRPFRNGKLLIWAEQGIGDEILYASLLPEVMAAGTDCVLECDARLVPLFGRSLPGLELVPRRNPADARLTRQDIAAQIPCGSLPMHLRPDVASFQRQRPFLRPDQRAREEFRSRHIGGNGDRGGRLVGLSWRTKNTANALARNIDLADVLSLFQGMDCTVISLQYDGTKPEIEAASRQTGVRMVLDDSVDPWNDLDGLAALIAAMDLVISIDNSTVHLAGALGVPTFTLLNHVPNWRWLRSGTESLWYPRMRLFRQPAPGDWAAVLRELGAALSERWPEPTS
ncbi:tetratricopeptide repeat protein [Azospirillum sp. SYSU D00513]|uniref:tetratricopeptide repeat protein n=1 Tax=Azospirillum sp. SYSU D00513 TaxID=2812561 RepID=UPI001A96B803|nr:tetratricopeptide repeat protein [Azospirillum sp. SYSU D00513]